LHIALNIKLLEFVTLASSSPKERILVNERREHNRPFQVIDRTYCF